MICPRNIRRPGKIREESNLFPKRLVPEKYLSTKVYNEKIFATAEAYDYLIFTTPKVFLRLKFIRRQSYFFRNIFIPGKFATEKVSQQTNIYDEEIIAPIATKCQN